MDRQADAYLVELVDVGLGLGALGAVGDEGFHWLGCVGMDHGESTRIDRLISYASTHSVHPSIRPSDQLQHSIAHAHTPARTGGGPHAGGEVGVLEAVALAAVAVEVPHVSLGDGLALHGEEVGLLRAALLLEEVVALLQEVLGALLLWLVAVGDGWGDGWWVVVESSWCGRGSRIERAHAHRTRARRGRGASACGWRP